MQLYRLIKQIRTRQIAIVVFALITGVVTEWTLLRFFTKPTVYDLVSQQVVVHQWLHGSMSTTHAGQTAYVLKMLLLYIPLDILPGSPRLKLLLITLVLNIATFILLGFTIRGILREFHVRMGGAFYAAMLWLSVIAGSVFWIGFANSRNLEVVGGLFLLLLGLRWLRQPSMKLGVGILLFGALLFFEDPLQVYMTALPLVVYTAVLITKRKERVRNVLLLYASLAAAYAASKLLFLIAAHWLHMSFSATGSVSTPPISLHWLTLSVAGSIKAGVSLVLGANDAGRLRKAANIVLFTVGLICTLYATYRRYIPRRLLLLVASVFVVNTAVFIASDQAEQGASASRYLIMLMPSVALLFGALRAPSTIAKPLAALTGVLLLINVFTLSGALASHWQTSFPQDAHLSSAFRYIHQNPGMHVYGSIDTAMPVLYLHALPASSILPVGCLDGRIVRTYYSMDKEFAASKSESSAPVALVLDGAMITNTPNRCTVSSISRQFGQPLSIDHTDDGSVVLRYRQEAFNLPPQ